MSTLVQISNSVQSIIENDGERQIEEIISLFTAERWEARHGKHSAHVHMDYNDVMDVDAWIDLNIASYSRLRNAVEDINEIFPGIPFKWLIERLYNYF